VTGALTSRIADYYTFVQTLFPFFNFKNTQGLIYLSTRRNNRVKLIVRFEDLARKYFAIVKQLTKNKRSVIVCGEQQTRQKIFTF